MALKSWTTESDLNKPRLLGMTIDELKSVAANVGMPPYAATQMADWLYKKHVASISGMTNIARSNRIELEERYEIGLSKPLSAQKSADGTVKYLFAVASGHCVETVYIPEKDRATLCVSSQAGCRMNCVFCMTGKQGLSANLTASDILNQILSVPETESLTNIVFMGMGEPFDNTDEVLKALDIITSDYGFGWSPKRVTVSTVGLHKGLSRFLESSQCHLAISLHSPFSAERLSIMPVEKAFPASETIRMLRRYDFSHQRRVSFEYIVFEDFNDTRRHADALARMLKDLPCRVNLIRFHSIPGVNMRSSSTEKIEQFCNTLNSKGIICTIRASRGEDISAACGMLSSAAKKTDEK